MFADSAGKKGGEFYTPSEVVKLLVALLKPKAGMKVYDPTCGSGGMLIQTRNYLKEWRSRSSFKKRLEGILVFFKDLSKLIGY